ncbi:hypothetical protein LAZ67_2002180 [Cordylochernes scorpioides]|uniref:Reverse transcriptase n=1 Tax=Cordylochernes scorpioides TaxID=51811 RepID=A0ABY6K3J7_9ARAC|nr:hypothetical protein LAZ67_2002180 [Cordylochernes scorpioides]
MSENAVLVERYLWLHIRWAELHRTDSRPVDGLKGPGVGRGTNEGGNICNLYLNVIDIVADKGGMTLIMDRTDYCRKMDEILEDQTTFKPINEIDKKNVKGSPMRSPLSSPIAEIVMRTIDTWITSLYPEDIIIYRRYIDDIFCICTDSQLSHILASLNSYHTNINFTVEK